MQHLKQPYYSMFVVILMALSSLSAATALHTTPEKTGIIRLYNDKGEEKCSWPIPPLHKYYLLSDPNEACENNMISSFLLENVPSATLIHFYGADSCTEAHSKENFYIKLKTVKAPTDWTDPTAPATGSISIDSMKSSKEGWLISKRNIRVEKSFVGSDFNKKSLNEQVSCIYIERSQTAN